MALSMFSSVQAVCCVVLLASMAPSTLAYRNSDVILEGDLGLGLGEGAAARSNTSASQEVGQACCCGIGGDFENHPRLRGYCPEEACFMNGREVWDINDCGSGGHYKRSCWKRNYGCGTIGGFMGAGNGPEDKVADSDPLSVYDQFKGEDFRCPSACNLGCCQMSKGWTLCGNDRCAKWKCITSEAYGDGELNSELTEHVCDPKTTKRNNGVGYKTDCLFTDAEKRQEPWDHERNPIVNEGLDSGSRANDVCER